MQTKFGVFLYCVLLISFHVTAQGQANRLPEKNKVPHLVKPKLVVGIVIDQMRWDYLYRFNTLYGPGGF